MFLVKLKVETDAPTDTIKASKRNPAGHRFLTSTESFAGTVAMLRYVGAPNLGPRLGVQRPLNL